MRSEGHRGPGHNVRHCEDLMSTLSELGATVKWLEKTAGGQGGSRETS